MGVDRWGVPGWYDSYTRASGPATPSRGTRGSASATRRTSGTPTIGNHGLGGAPPPPPLLPLLHPHVQEAAAKTAAIWQRAGAGEQVVVDARTSTPTPWAPRTSTPRSRRPSCGPSSSRARRTRASSRTTRGGPEQGEGHAAPAEPWPRRAAGRASSIEPAAPLQVCRTAHTHTLHLHSTPHLCFQNRYRRKFKQQIRAASSSSSKNARHQGIASRLPTQLTPLMGERHQRTPSCYSWGVITRTECKLRLF